MISDQKAVETEMALERINLEEIIQKLQDKKYKLKNTKITLEERVAQLEAELVTT